MNMEISVTYDKQLEETKTLEKRADAAGLTLLTNKVGTVHSFCYPFAVLQDKDGRYFIQTADGVYEMKKTNESEDKDGTYLHKITVKFRFTPDGKHIWIVEIFKSDAVEWCITNIEALHLPANEKFIRSGDCCTYEGLTLTFDNESCVAISKSGKSANRIVREDSQYIYQFKKRIIRAKYGAYGLFSHMENIAEQAKINNLPFWADSYRLMNDVFK